MLIRKLDKIDVNKVAYLHLKAFENFFLSKFGKRFLVEFYKSILKSKFSINIGLFEGEQLVGFAVGSTVSKSFYLNILKKNFIKLGIAAVPSLLINPLLLYRLFTSFGSTIRYNDNNNSILLSICIDPSFSKKGYGGLLISRFEEIAFNINEKIILTTDAENNETVNNFYIKNGYVLTKIFNQGKRKMNLYIKMKQN